MRRLVEHERRRQRAQRRQQLATLLRLRGQEADEHEPLGLRPAADTAVATADGPGIGTTR